MRILLGSIAALVAIVAAALVIGVGPTQSRWGEEGVRAMWAIGGICLISAVVGALPLGIVAPRWPAQIGQATLAGTVVRLLLTMLLGAAYQVLAQPHLTAFLFWAVVLYLLLLAVETAFGVLAVRRYYHPPKTRSEGSHA